jgi:hypothetical protein
MPKIFIQIKRRILNGCKLKLFHISTKDERIATHDSYRGTAQRFCSKIFSWYQKNIII